MRTILILLALLTSADEEKIEVPDFVVASDFASVLTSIHTKELGLSPEQINEFQRLRFEYNDAAARLPFIRKDELDEELQKLDRAERLEVLRSRLTEHLVPEYYKVLTPAQRKDATRHVLEHVMHPGAFRYFLQRPTVKEALKITDSMLVEFEEPEVIGSEKRMKIEEIDRELRQQVLSVLAKNDRERFMPYLPESDISNPTLGAEKWLTEIAEWPEIEFLLRLEPKELELLEMTDEQLYDFKIGRKVADEEYRKAFLNMLNEKQPHRLPREERLRVTKEVTDQSGEIGRKLLLERIDQSLIPKQVQQLSALSLQRCFSENQFYRYVHNERVLEFLDCDKSNQQKLELAAQKASEERSKLLQEFERSFRFRIVEQLPKEQQELFKKYYGKYLD